MATATALYEQRDLSRLRVWPPRASVRSAVVLLDRLGEPRLVSVQKPIDPFEFAARRFRQLFRVELAPIQAAYDGYQLPSQELARPFRVDFKLTVVVIDPVAVVAARRIDVWDAIEPVLGQELRRIGRSYQPEQVAEVEENTRFRTQLEQQEEQHRRELEESRIRHRHALDREHEEHHHDLERRRRELYAEAMGEEVLPKLLLLKLGARPAGGDPKEVDEVIEALKQARVDDVKVPFELLANHIQLMERWQLEEPVGELIDRLLARFEPRAAPKQIPEK